MVLDGETTITYSVLIKLRSFYPKPLNHIL